MLFLIGLGLDQSPTLKALQVMKKCSKIFYESYTSPVINKDLLSDLESHLSGRKIEEVSREFVEDGSKILDLARQEDIALVCSGDPLIATTHQELRTRALSKKIETRIIHGSSVLSSVVGDFGLHAYNFGKTVTMTREPMQYTAYNTIYQNLLRGLHTIILLEWDQSTGFFLSPMQAMKSLLDAELDLKYDFLKNESLVLVASRLGSEESALKVETVESLDSTDLGAPPHVIVFPGRLHFTEKEALSAICGWREDKLPDNSLGVERIAVQMVKKYSQKTLAALERAKKIAKDSKKYQDVFENVDCYTQDSLRFLNEGKEELAVLSIGYAEGLLDSLRFSGELDFEW